MGPGSLSGVTSLRGQQQDGRRLGWRPGMGRLGRADDLYSVAVRRPRAQDQQLNRVLTPTAAARVAGPGGTQNGAQLSIEVIRDADEFGRR
jgi:hypothetical protein